MKTLKGTGQESPPFVADPWGTPYGRQDAHESGASPSGACPQISAGQSSELQKEPKEEKA